MVAPIDGGLVELVDGGCSPVPSDSGPGSPCFWFTPPPRFISQGAGHAGWAPVMPALLAVALWRPHPIGNRPWCLSAALPTALTTITSNFEKTQNHPGREVFPKISRFSLARANTFATWAAPAPAILLDAVR